MVKVYSTQHFFLPTEAERAKYDFASDIIIVFDSHEGEDYVVSVYFLNDPDNNIRNHLLEIGWELFEEKHFGIDGVHLPDNAEVAYNDFIAELSSLDQVEEARQ